ncbi:MAG: NUDIX hydrolase [Propionibacteriaceae bacterium]
MATDSRHVLARLDTTAPPGLVRRVEAWHEGGRRPTEPALATSVVLLREQGSALEAYLLRRHERMAFAAGMTVFPGGKVDPPDHDHPHGPLVAAGVRETREETSVELDADTLLPWAQWITPEPEPLRYDTHFFVALMPSGQRAADVSGEADLAWWSTPAAALAGWQDGRVRLMPPTASILLELADCARWTDVLDATTDRRIGPVLPAMTRTDAGWCFDYLSGGADG